MLWNVLRVVHNLYSHRHQLAVVSDLCHRACRLTTTLSTETLWIIHIIISNFLCFSWQVKVWITKNNTKPPSIEQYNSTALQSTASNVAIKLNQHFTGLLLSNSQAQTMCWGCRTYNIWCLCGTHPLNIHTVCGKILSKEFKLIVSSVN